MLVPNLRLLNEPWLVLVWIGIALLNPWVEEGYWRGLLMDAAGTWHPSLAIAYSTFGFALAHPLILGVNAHALAGLEGLIGSIVVGCPWAIVYAKSRSLRWPIVGHAFQDLVTVPVLVFLNRAILPM
jgi:CAAX protease family protein